LWDTPSRNDALPYQAGAECLSGTSIAPSGNRLLCCRLSSSINGTQKNTHVIAYMGHTNLETTAFYMSLVGDEARAEVVGAW